MKDKLDLIIYGYSYLVLIPFILFMIKEKFKIGWGIYVAETIILCISYFLLVDLSKITIDNLVVLGLAICGSAFFLYACQKFKNSDTSQRVEANKVLLALGISFYVVSNPSIVSIIFIAGLLYITYQRVYSGIGLPIVTSFINKCFSTTYSKNKNQ